MAEDEKPLLIKRYASRRLYNTETSDYVTLEDISEFIRDGREVQIIDLKSGDDLTRQYLLQIIAEHESRGENVLPINVLTDLVRSYTTHATSMVPDFLSASFEMLQQGQSQMMENMAKANPLASSFNQMPGMDSIRAQQEAFLKAMTGGGMPGMTGKAPEEGEPAKRAESDEGLDDIKKQLADLQDKLSKLSK
ncbi:polyhydroxyalkanoate synthesis repressor PhaR [Roseovarius sp. SK2]|uniref:polyhydroxyalkanoate synthesis repressor PhaR n=1 Tax=Roseovarius TaxID=74030 RepID=UPI000CDCEA85|nr:MULTISPECIES: polyhydroxyalkanoate synthesis repressor PhaR [Roseovarius]MDD9724337.1 polyhydroxyalkanoate synthesis repressor PhaR [Roseovarius sp. SK2]